MASRQVTSVSPEPIAREQSEKIAIENPAVDKLRVGIRSVPSMTMEHLKAPQLMEEELENVESCVLKEGAVDEFLQEGEKRAEQDTPEEEGLEAAKGPADDTAEELKDTLSDMDADAEVAKETVRKEENEVNEPGLLEELYALSRGFPVEQAEPVEKEAEAETLTQIEIELELQRTSKIKVTLVVSAPFPDVDVPPEEALEAEEPVEVAASDAAVIEDIQDVAPEPADEIHDIGSLAEAGVEVQDVPREPSGLEEELEDEVFVGAENDMHVTAPAPVEPEVDRTGSVKADVKEIPEDVASDADVPQENEKAGEVLHDAPRGKGVDSVQAADETKEHQEAFAADEDISPEDEEPEEVFHGASRKIEAPLRRVHGEAEETIAVEEKEAKPLEEESFGADKHLSEEFDEKDQHLIEEAGQPEPRECVTAAHAAGDDDDKDEEQEPMEQEFETRDVVQEAEVSDNVEGKDEEVVLIVSLEPKHGSMLQQQANHFIKVSSGSPANAVERAAIDNILMGDEQPRDLDPTSDPEPISEDISMRTKVEQPTISDMVVEPTAAMESVMEEKEEEGDAKAQIQEVLSETVEERTSDFAPLESQPAEAILESHHETGVDLSSGPEEAVPGADKIVLSGTVEEVQEETTTPAQPDFQSHGVDEDFVISDGGEGDSQDVTDPMDENVQECLHASLAEEVTNEMEQTSETSVAHTEVGMAGEEDHGPRTELKHLDEIGAVIAEGAQGLERDEGDEDIEEVDATREDYDADTEMETEQPVMAFATLNVFDDDIENDEDGEGVPADLDDHSDVEEFEYEVNEDHVYGRAVVEEVSEDIEMEEEISATAEHEAHGMKGADEAEGIPTEQDNCEDAKDTFAAMEKEWNEFARRAGNKCDW